MLFLYLLVSCVDDQDVYMIKIFHLFVDVYMIKIFHLFVDVYLIKMCI